MELNIIILVFIKSKINLFIIDSIMPKTNNKKAKGNTGKSKPINKWNNKK